MTQSSPSLALTDPVRLLPVRIAKPWGEELWFSGIEERGESSVVLNGEPRPLSTALTALGASPVDVPLLKVLAPSAKPKIGDLYFEVHEHKREVYIVTGIALEAWPDGCGEMRHGFCQTARRAADSDEAFRTAYLAAANSYQELRHRIDAGERGLKTAEVVARKAMERFINTRPLLLGDVVTVDAWMPHGLRHGVRVVEFQNQSFDRQILSFGQQAWTQRTWDTEQALPNLCLDAPAMAQPPCDAHVIAEFDDLVIERQGPTAQAARTLTCDGLTIVMAVAGTCRVGKLTLNHEEAALIPTDTTVTVEVPAGAYLYSGHNPRAG